jgi:tRNA1(Val) A37 N6-methylase TrmN6
VLCNPPFFAPHAALDVTSERIMARHELHGALADFVDAAASALSGSSSGAAAKFVLPPSRLSDLFAAAGSSGLLCVSLRFVHAAPSENAHLAEAVLRKCDSNAYRAVKLLSTGKSQAAQSASGPLLLRSPLFVRGEDGRYTEEVARRIAGAALDAAALAALSHAEVERVRGTCARTAQTK